MGARERPDHSRRAQACGGQTRRTRGRALLSALVLDAGALIAIDRNDRDVAALLLVARRRGIELRASAMVVAQVWRDPRGRQARLAAALRSIHVYAVDEPLARDAGVLLGRTGTSDAIDATVALIADDGDEILTSDPHDISRLVMVTGKSVAVVPC